MATENDPLIAQIGTLVDELLAPHPDLFLVEVEMRGRLGGMRKVNVLLDGDQGIGIDQVVELSRALGARLEEIDLIKGAYNLEVGSPGIDHPLLSPRQFKKNVGRGLKLETAEGQTLDGTITAADDAGLTLTPDAPAKGPKKGPAPEPVTLPYGQVKKAVVQIRF